MAAKRCSRRGKFPGLTVFDPVFQVNKRIRKIAELQDVAGSLTRGTAKRIQELKDVLVQQRKPHDAMICQLLLEIFMIAKKHRKEFAKGKRKKIMRFIAGVIGWRFTPYGTTIHNVQKTIKWMEKNGFGKYIRMVPEIDKQLLIRDRTKMSGKIPGVSITRTEEFGVEPAVTKTRVALPVKRLERLAKKALKSKR